LRIIGGKHKSRTIKAPAGLPARPTTDFAKEGLFNVLNNRVDFETLHVLDLYCGTGNISFEFLSRGAVAVTAVDQHAKSMHFITNEVKKLGEENLTAIRSDVFQFLKKNTSTYDLIFADPPYADSKYAELFNLILDSKSLKTNGILIIEHQRKVDLSNLNLYQETKNYGNVSFSFFYA